MRIILNWFYISVYLVRLGVRVRLVGLIIVCSAWCYVRYMISISGVSEGLCSVEEGSVFIFSWAGSGFFVVCWRWLEKLLIC